MSVTEFAHRKVFVYFCLAENAESADIIVAQISQIKQIYKNFRYD